MSAPMTLDEQVRALQRQYGVTEERARHLLRSALPPQWGVADTGSGKRHAFPAPRPKPAPVTLVTTVDPVTLTLTGRVASAKNHTRPTVRNGKVTGIRKSKAAQAWQDDAVAQMARRWPAGRPAITAPVIVRVRYFGPLSHPHACDIDNADAAILDALVKAKVLADDRRRIVRQLDPLAIDAPDWRTVVRIEPYEPRELEWWAR